MLNKIFAAIILCGMAINGMSQATTKQRIIYRMEHVRFKEEPSFRYQEEFSVYISGSISLFRSRTKEIADSLNKAAFERMTAKGGGELVMSNKPSTNESIYFDHKTSTVKKCLKIRQQEYVVDQPYPAIKWKKNAGTKRLILGYTCLQAIGVFGGRTYTVWYAPALGGNVGPWKLCGLPGVILYAEDEKKEVVFTAIAMQQLQQPFNVTLPGRAIVAKQAEIDKLVAAGPIANSKNGDVKIEGIKVEGGGNLESKSKRISNPLELQ